MDKKQDLTVSEETKFSKEALLQAKKFANQRDVLSGVMREGEFLTVKEAELRLKRYLKGKVN